MVLEELRLGLVQFNWTSLFQIVNTIVLISIIYLIYKLIKKIFGGKSKLELRVSDLEDELKKLKDNE
jgi:amino acid permease